MTAVQQPGPTDEPPPLRYCPNFFVQIFRAVYIGKYPWGEYQQMSFGGKKMKRKSEKGGKCKRKRKKGERKRKEGEENEKRGSKRVK
jgi:hypothetical protein